VTFILAFILTLLLVFVVEDIWQSLIKKYEASLVVEYTDDLLKDLTSKDSTKIWSASCKIRHIYDRDRLLVLSDYIDDIIEATKGVDLGGGFVAGVSHLNSAIQKLKYIKYDGGCLCHLYPGEQWYNIHEEEKYGNVVITGKVPSVKGHPDDFLCKCCHCHQNFKVRFFDDYHYEFYGWEKT